MTAQKRLGSSAVIGDLSDSVMILACPTKSKVRTVLVAIADVGELMHVGRAAPPPVRSQR